MGPCSVEKTDSRAERPGWGTRIRTLIARARILRPAVRRSPKGSAPCSSAPRAAESTWAAWIVKRSKSDPTKKNARHQNPRRFARFAGLSKASRCSTPSLPSLNPLRPRCMPSVVVARRTVAMIRPGCLQRALRAVGEGARPWSEKGLVPGGGFTTSRPLPRRRFSRHLGFAPRTLGSGKVAAPCCVPLTRRVTDLLSAAV